jgi:hypothetical protein
MLLPQKMLCIENGRMSLREERATLTVPTNHQIRPIKSNDKTSKLKHTLPSTTTQSTTTPKLCARDLSTHTHMQDITQSKLTDVMMHNAYSTPPHTTTFRHSNTTTNESNHADSTFLIHTSFTSLSQQDMKETTTTGFATTI